MIHSLKNIWFDDLAATTKKLLKIHDVIHGTFHEQPAVLYKHWHPCPASDSASD